MYDIFRTLLVTLLEHMRREPRAIGEPYHAYNRGNDRRNIFRDERDYVRFLLSMLLLQSEYAPDKLDRIVHRFLKRGVLPFSVEEITQIVRKSYVHIVAFALMPNHFHLLLIEQCDGGISMYMQRLLNSYTKYFNTKRERDGHLFQGAYQSVHVQDDEQLLYLSTYIHRNPRGLPRWRGNEHIYPWSSYQDYISDNRWGALLQPHIVLAHFSKDGDRYKRYAEQSGAKDHAIDSVLFIDRGAVKL